MKKYFLPILLLIFALACVAVLVSYLTQGPDMMDYGLYRGGAYNMMGYGYSSFGWFGMVFMMIVCGLIILGIILFVRWIVLEYSQKTGRGSSSVVDILKERYAKGEISKEEFEQKKKDVM